MAPSDAYLALLDEINRIVHSPYPTQLKTLRDIVCTQCTGDDISRWVLSQPCQIYKLIRCILDAVRHWSYTLDLVTRLSCNVTFRDAFLEAEPTLLHDVVVQAAQTEDPASRYADAAVALLAHRLPTSVAIPMQCQTLLVRLFDHAASHPSIGTIRPIYQFLRGSGASLIGVLSESILLRFESHLFTITRNLKGDDQSLSLYCLAIMKSLAQASEESLCGSVVSSYDTQELLATTDCSTSNKWRPDAVRQYFAEHKAQKTMQLVVLRVMWACTATTNDSLHGRMESLKLANEIITAVPPHERELWRTANTLVPKKLEEKLGAPALDTGLRFQALCFLLRLTAGGSISAAALDGLRNLILNIKDFRYMQCDDNTRLVDELVRCGIFDANTTTAFLQNTVDFISSSSADAVAERSSSLISVLQHLLTAVSWQDATSDGIILALDVLACGQKLRYLGGNRTPAQNISAESDDSETCTKMLLSKRQRLVHELCRLFLKASLLSSQSAYSIPHETLSLLLDLHATSALTTTHCEHTQDRKSTARKCTFVETQCTPSITASDWRKDLESELAIQSASHRDRLESLCIKACSELEDRCNNVEQPLQEEREKLSALQAKYDKLHAVHAAIEVENIDRNLQFDALEAERDQALADLRSVREEHEVLEARIEELRCKVRSTASQADQDIAASRRALDTAELAHAAVLASKEEELEDARESVHSLGQQLMAKDSELATAGISLGNAISDLEAAQESIRLFEHTIADQQRAMRILTEDKELASESRERLEKRCAALVSQIDEAHDAHRTELCRLEEQAMQNLASQKTDYEMQLAAHANEHTVAVHTIELKLAEVAANAHAAAQEHVREVQQCRAELNDNQKKLERLQRKYEQKAQRLASATAMQQNIAAAMGLRTAQSLQVPHRSLTASIAQTPHHHNDHEIEEHDESQDSSPPTPFSGDDLESQQPSSGEVDVESAPTPKHQRPRKAFKIPSPAKPQARMSTTARTSLARISTAKRTTRASLRAQSREDIRQPLMYVSANCQSPAAANGTKTPAKGGKDSLDDTTWDGSEIFSGTQF